MLAAGRRAGACSRGCTPTSWGPARGCRSPCEVDAASADHCTFLTDADVDLLASSATVATLLPGAEFSCRQPYPDARRLLGAGVTVALATDCNPGSCFTSSMAFCMALAVREMGMTPEEAVWSATAGGAPCAAPERCGAPRRGRPGRPADAGRAVAHLPGVPSRGAADRGRLARGPPGRRPPPGPGRLTGSPAGGAGCWPAAQPWPYRPRRKLINPAADRGDRLRPGASQGPDDPLHQITH